MEKIRCKYNPTSYVLVIELDDGEVRDVDCEYISGGHCSQIGRNCFYYEDMPQKKQERKTHRNRRARGTGM